MPKLSVSEYSTRRFRSDSAVISAIQRAIELKSTYNIRVMNLSLGRPVAESCALDPLCQAVEQAWEAGIVVVVAAGNEGRDNSASTGYATVNCPGNSPFVITVGAINTLGTLSRLDDKVTSYSSKGPTLIDHYIKPDLVAPVIASFRSVTQARCWTTNIPKIGFRYSPTAVAQAHLHPTTISSAEPAWPPPWLAGRLHCLFRATRPSRRTW